MSLQVRIGCWQNAMILDSCACKLTLVCAALIPWVTRPTPSPAPVYRRAAGCYSLASRCLTQIPNQPTTPLTSTSPQSGLLFAWLLPRSRLYALHKAHGPIHSVVCWHLLVAPHIASPPERPPLLAQARSATFAVSFETTHGQAHTIAVRFDVMCSVLCFCSFFILQRSR